MPTPTPIFHHHPAPPTPARRPPLPRRPPPLLPVGVRIVVRRWAAAVLGGASTGPSPSPPQVSSPVIPAGKFTQLGLTSPLSSSILLGQDLEFSFHPPAPNSQECLWRGSPFQATTPLFAQPVVRWGFPVASTVPLGRRGSTAVPPAPRRWSSRLSHSDPGQLPPSPCIHPLPPPMQSTPTPPIRQPRGLCIAVLPVSPLISQPRVRADP